MKRSNREKYLILAVIILIQIVLYYPSDWHRNLDIVTFIEGILRFPNAPFVSILLFTAAYALFSKDEKLSFIAGFLSWMSSIIGWVISGRYYGSLVIGIALATGIATVYGLAGIKFVRLDKKYNFKIDIYSLVYTFLGIISMLVGIRISIEFLEYIAATHGFPLWSYDIRITTFALIGSIVFGLLSFLVCGRKKYPKVFRDSRRQHVFEWMMCLSILVIIVYIFYIIWGAMYPPL